MLFRSDLPTDAELIEVRVLGGESIGPRRVASYIVESIEDDYTAAVPNAMVATLLTTQSDIPPAKRDLSNFDHLSSLPFIDVNDGIGMIIGVSHCTAWTGEKCKTSRGPPGTPMGLWTSFGWTIQGGGGTSGAGSINCNALSAGDNLLRESLDRIYFHDFATVSEEGSGQSKEEKEAIRQLQNSITFDDQRGKYVVGLPWRYGREKSAQVINAVNSRAMAERRLKSMIPRLRKDEERRKRIFAEVKKFEEKGVSIDVNDEDVGADPTLPVWHLPLLVVEERNKTRICHDAKASAEGISLNSMLLGGPNLTNSLAAIRSEEHTSELQSQFRISYAVFCLKKKKQQNARVSLSQTTID